MGHRTTVSARCLTAALLSLTLLAVAPVRAELMNPNFSGTFAPWEGAALFEDLDTGDIDVVDIPDPATRSDLFALTGSGGAQLSTSTDSSTGPFGTDWFGVALGQVFDVPTDAATISFDYAWKVTDVDLDSVEFTMLYDPGVPPVAILDLLQGGNVDTTAMAASGRAEVNIRSWAGRQGALFEVFLSDGDFWLGDTLTIGNIVISRAAVPAPPILALMALGALMLRFAGRRASV